MDILAAGRLYIQDIGHEPCILAGGIEASEGERFFFIFFLCNFWDFDDDDNNGDDNDDDDGDE